MSHWNLSIALGVLLIAEHGLICGCARQVLAKLPQSAERIAPSLQHRNHGGMSLDLQEKILHVTIKDFAGSGAQMADIIKPVSPAVDEVSLSIMDSAALDPELNSFLQAIQIANGIKLSLSLQGKNKTEVPIPFPKLPSQLTGLNISNMLFSGGLPANWWILGMHISNVWFSWNKDSNDEVQGHHINLHLPFHPARNQSNDVTIFNTTSWNEMAAWLKESQMNTSVKIPVETAIGVDLSDFDFVDEISINGDPADPRPLTRLPKLPHIPNTAHRKIVHTHFVDVWLPSLAMVVDLMEKVERMPWRFSWPDIFISYNISGHSLDMASAVHMQYRYFSWWRAAISDEFEHHDKLTSFMNTLPLTQELHIATGPSLNNSISLTAFKHVRALTLLGDDEKGTDLGLLSLPPKLRGLALKNCKLDLGSTQFPANHTR